MSSYRPPSEDITEFNSSLFNTPQINLTQAQADLLYLSKTKNDTSTATTTTFSGSINAASFTTSGSGALFTRNIFSTSNTAGHEIFGAMTTGGTLTIGGTLSTNNIRGVTTFPQRVVAGTSFNLYPTLGTNNTVIGNTTASTSLVAGSAENVIIGTSNIGAGLTSTGINNVLIGRAGGINSTNSNIVSIGNGVNGRGDNGVFIGTGVTSSGIGNWNVLIGNNATATSSGNNPAAGVAVGYQTSVSGNNGICVGFNSKSNSTGNENMAVGSSALITAGTGINNIAFGYQATVNANISNSVAIGASAVASVSNTIVLGTASETIYIPNRIQFTPSTYSFPFASTQQLGYYLTNTGTGQSVTSATQTSILTTSSIPVGVWRVDFSVKNTTGATGGTITAAQSYIATSAASTTPLAFTGALVRAHVTETYVTGDIQIITSSFTLQVSTAQTYSLTILRTFAAGTFTFIGECSFTRLG